MSLFRTALQALPRRALEAGRFAPGPPPLECPASSSLILPRSRSLRGVDVPDSLGRWCPGAANGNGKALPRREAAGCPVGRGWASVSKWSRSSSAQSVPFSAVWKLCARAGVVVPLTGCDGPPSCRRLAPPLPCPLSSLDEVRCKKGPRALRGLRKMAAAALGPLLSLNVPSLPAPPAVCPTGASGSSPFSLRAPRSRSSKVKAPRKSEVDPG